MPCVDLLVDSSSLGYREPKCCSIMVLRSSRRLSGEGGLTGEERKSVSAAATGMQTESCCRGFEVDTKTTSSTFAGAPCGAVTGTEGTLLRHP